MHLQYLGQSDEICKRFLRGQCLLGEFCWRQHPAEEASEERQEECSVTSNPLTDSNGQASETALVRRGMTKRANRPGGVCHPGSRACLPHLLLMRNLHACNRSLPVSRGLSFLRTSHQAEGLRL